MAQFDGGRKRILSMILLIAAVILTVGTVSASLLYNAAITEERTRLTEIAQSQARLIEAVYRFDSEYSNDYPEGSLKATLSQIEDAHMNYGGFGETGEFTVARLENDQIVFLFSLRHQTTEDQLIIPMNSGLAEPQQRALSGESGTMVGIDYRGKSVLAAYEPVAGIELGIVAKIDMAEIRHPFQVAGLYIMLASLLVLLGGSLVVLWVGAPMVEQINESMEALRENEEMFRSAFDSSGVGMVLIDHTGQYVQVNPAMEKLMGYTEEEMLNMTIKDLTYPGDMDAESPQIRGIWQGENDRLIFEKRFVTKDGSIIWGLTSASLVRDARGKPKYLFGQFQDISKRKQVEAELRELNENLEQVVRDRTQQLESFSYSVSHDLRAPLRAITGFSQILLDEYVDKFDEAGKDYFDRIIQSCNRMDRLIDDLLTLSRQGRQALKLELIKLSESAELISARIEEENPDRELIFKIQQDQSDCQGEYGDPNLIDVVLTNLFANAVKFSSNRSPAVIEFGCYAEENDRIFFVRDNGIGFDMSNADRLFLPFQRLHTHEYEGNGIGLALVEQIIRRHNGRIWVDSEVDSGTTFYFTLGIKPEDLIS